MSFEHFFSLNAKVVVGVADPNDVHPDIIIEALEARLAALKKDRKNWADHAEHYHTEEIS
ncbi:MAG: hypothetical protein WC869_01180 [Phycisphaerae bacterium]|jgi:hypothetical protein